MMSLAAYHFGLGCFVLAVEVVRYTALRRLDFLMLAMAMYALCYGFAPAALYWAKSVGYVHSWSGYVDYDAMAYGFRAYDVAAIAVLIAYIGIQAGWLVAATSRWAGDAKRRRNPAGAGSTLDLTPLAWAMLISSVGVYFLYTRAYGGYLRILSVAAAIRGGWADIDNPWSFLKPLGGLSMFSSYLFLALLLARPASSSRRLRLWLGLVLSVAYSMYVNIVWGGRLAMILYVLALLLAIASVQARRLSSMKLLLALCLTLVGLYFCDGLIRGARVMLLGLGGAPQMSISTREAERPLDFALDELSFPMISIATSCHAVSEAIVTPRFLSDYLLAVAYLMPDRLQPPLPDKVSSTNTWLISPGALGEVPVDLISFALYSLGLFGLPVLGLGYGAGLRCVQAYAQRIQPPYLRPVLFPVLGLTIARALIYADPTNVLKGASFIILGLASVWLCRRLQTRARTGEQ